MTNQRKTGRKPVTPLSGKWLETKLLLVDTKITLYLYIVLKKALGDRLHVSIQNPQANKQSSDPEREKLSLNERQGPYRLESQSQALR